MLPYLFLDDNVIISFTTTITKQKWVDLNVPILLRPTVFQEISGFTKQLHIVINNINNRS